MEPQADPTWVPGLSPAVPLPSRGPGACSQSAKDPGANSHWTLTTWSLPKASPRFSSVAQASWHLAPPSFRLCAFPG